MSLPVADLASDQIPIPFNDLRTQLLRLRPKIDDAIARVLDGGAFILGPEVKQLEDALATFAAVRHAITCASGTDALSLALLAIRMEPNDAVFLPSFTFAATAEPLCFLGGTPVFVDVRPDTFNMDSGKLKQAITLARRSKLNPRAIIAVDLFGQPADYTAIGAIAESDGLILICDAAQSFGATYRNGKVGQFGRLTTTSFFPAKPLGCYGDGGAIFTNDEELAGVLRSLRVHGQGTDKYDNVRIGTNSRLDTVQAAILLAKLEIFPEEIAARRTIAARYQNALGEIVDVPVQTDGASSVWAQYTIKHPRRDDLAGSLRERGIPTAIYYPQPLHQQPAYRQFVLSGQDLSVSEQIAREVLSLPMSAYLLDSDQDRVIQAVSRYVGSRRGIE